MGSKIDNYLFEDIPRLLDIMLLKISYWIEIILFTSISKYGWT